MSDLSGQYSGNRLSAQPEGGEGRLVPESGGRLMAEGDWTVAHAPKLYSAIAATGSAGIIDLGALRRLDTSGAHLLVKLADRTGAGIENCPERYRSLIERVAAAEGPPAELPVASNPLIRTLARLGRGTERGARRAVGMIAFLGAVCEVWARTAMRPKRFRLTATVRHMEDAGLSAFPIVMLISFLVGIVMAFQGAAQLQRFGAEIFVVNLIGISVLREIGILLTAIVVAGRSGSAFAAQIGSMKVNEEVDALKSLGLDPMEVLVLPRVLALSLMMCPMAFMADISGLIGGGLMAWLALDIPPALFAERLGDAIPLSALMVGLVKAPVFGALIAMVGCYEGLRTEGSAESLGRQTTRAVVEGIFIVIVVDALFSIFFNLVGV
ncbi:MAG: MlaE family lipid ABC transporter permease subunit [Minwuia sp.]|uniref:ABC transporter permease n=1 Tax=Minwuia sp. TaxID=2493630 RepID=UPI003A8C34DA